jgi:hypothetical protein
MSYTEPWEWDEDPDPEWEARMKEPMDLNTWGELQADKYKKHDTVQTIPTEQTKGNGGREDNRREDK